MDGRVEWENPLVANGHLYNTIVCFIDLLLNCNNLVKLNLTSTQLLLKACIIYYFQLLGDLIKRIISLMSHEKND